MKKIFSIALLTLLLTTACKKDCNNSGGPAVDVPAGSDNPSTGLPACVQKKIDQMKAEPVRNPAGSVWQYQYNGQIVYYIPSYCCDAMSELFDGKCNHICSPDGGLTGKGDGQCSNFFEARTNEMLIWQDNR